MDFKACSLVVACGSGKASYSVKLHWSPKSPFVRKVMIVAHELGLADQIEKVRSVAAMNVPNPSIMEANPLSKIPTLVLDDSEPIFDSLVICEYLDSLGGGGIMIPPSGRARWTALTWHALGSGLLDLLILWRNEREKPAERQTTQTLVAFAAKTDAALMRFKELVPALAQARFGLGHVAIGCALSYMDFRFADLGWRERHPALANWYESFAARPSVRATEIVDD